MTDPEEALLTALFVLHLQMVLLVCGVRFIETQVRTAKVKT
jgi:hypothetical protein